MAKRKTELGLGRGLNALLGDPELSASGEGSVSLPISQVEPGLKQPRKRFDEESLQDLADSIRIHGIIQPLTVRRLSSGYYQIIAGERRWRAAKQAGLDEIPAVIIEADDRKVMEIGLIENLQREDLNPAEEARGYQTLMEEYGLTQEQVAERMGKSRPAVTNTLRLLALPEDLLTMVEEGTLSAGHARAILGAPTQALQREVAKHVVERGLSVRQTEALVKTIQKQQERPKEKGRDEISLYLGELEKSLSGRWESPPPCPRYDCLLLGVTFPREEVCRRIDVRLQARIDAGMLDEVAELRANGATDAFLEGLGLEYRYILRYLTGQIPTLDGLRDELGRAIKRFAKRQMVWFKKDRDVLWLDMEGDFLTQAVRAVEGFLA